MSEDVELGCKCGSIHGKLTDASPDNVNRAVCYCDDCQAFLHHLGRADLLDAKGGTDIIQVAPATVTFDRGMDRIEGLRLTPKGVYRFYASCCKTPLGNTVGPLLPFLGIASELFRVDARRRDEIFGPVRAAIHGKFAVGGPPEGSTSVPLRMIARAARLMLGWKLRGKGWPHPYFDRATHAPRPRIVTLTPAERDALRPLCGPHPTATAAR